MSEAQVREGSAPIVLPGFIDLHVHGGAGHDIMEGGDAAWNVARLHAQHGTTSLLATTMTAPQSGPGRRLCRTRTFVHRTCAPTPPACWGCTWRGRTSARRAWARNRHSPGPRALSEIHRLHALAPIRLITLAPEVGGNEALIAQLVAEGFKVQLGHTTGSYEQGVAALRCGATGFTHLFNAMSALHHREPGMVGAALAHAEFAEVIPDLLHVHPGAIHAALRSIPKLYCVTDSTSAAGMPDGDYKLGRHTVTKCMGGVRLADGTLAGSVLSMDQALRNLVNTLGLSLADASSRVSTFAADHMGLADRGRLQTGAWADAVVLNRDLQVQAVVVEGYAVRNT